IDMTVRGLSRDVLSAMLRDAVVVGMRPADAPDSTALGLRHMVPADAPVDEILAAIEAALHGEQEGPGAQDLEAAAAERPGAEGRLVAVWGPHGAPGRSTVAVNLAAEAAAAGREADRKSVGEGNSVRVER